MSRLIDADALEREGWSLCRTFQKDKDTMVYEVKKPSDFPPIEEWKTGKPVVKSTGYRGYWACDLCKIPETAEAVGTDRSKGILESTCMV